jgi:glutamate dehydrogenase/leucine dehydrogenase
MPIVRLHSVAGCVAFDLDGCDRNAGGTRMAADVTEREAMLLARAMTYKLAVLGAAVGGAKAVIRHDPASPDRAEVMARFCEEVQPLVEARRFATGPDMGTTEADFAPLRPLGAAPSAMSAVVDGVAFEELLTGFGVVVAAETAVGSLDGCTVAIEGFGKVGGGVAREVVARGGRIVAVSTTSGCVADPAGLDVERLWALRTEHGDGAVAVLAGDQLAPPEALFTVDADVIVPGARPGTIDARRASELRCRVVAPAANVPYTADSVAVLRARGVVALPDYVCSAGAVIGYRSPRDATPAEVLTDVQARLAQLVQQILDHPDGALAGGTEIAEAFLATWRGPNGLPPGPPLA